MIGERAIAVAVLREYLNIVHDATTMYRTLRYRETKIAGMERRGSHRQILSRNRDGGEPTDPSCDATDPPPTDPPRASESGRGRAGGSENGFDSVIGVRAGPVRITGTPLTGRIGDPRANRFESRSPGSNAMEPLQ